MLRRILGVDERDVSYERLLDALGVGGKGSLFESDQLDYKSELPQDSKKFAKAVTAFANKGGGVLVYGIKDVKEAAGRVEHVELGQATTSLNQRLNQSMRPLIPGLRWTPVEFPEQKGYGLLLLEIPPSPLAPHAVLDRHQAHFYWRQGRESVPMNEGDIERAYRERFQSRDEARGLLGEARSWLPESGAASPGRMFVLFVPSTRAERLYSSPAEGVRVLSAIQRTRGARLPTRSFLGDHTHPRIRRIVASRYHTYDKDDRSGERAVIADNGAVALWEEFADAGRLRHGDNPWAEFGPDGVCATAQGYTSASMFTQTLVMLMVSVRELVRGYQVSGALDLVFGVQADCGVGWITSWREVKGVLQDSGEFEYSLDTEDLELPGPFGRLVGDVFRNVVAGFGFLNVSPVDEHGRFEKRWLEMPGFEFDAGFWEEKGIMIAEDGGQRD